MAAGDEIEYTVSVNELDSVVKITFDDVYFALSSGANGNVFTNVLGASCVRSIHSDFAYFCELDASVSTEFTITATVIPDAPPGVNDFSAILTNRANNDCAVDSQSVLVGDLVSAIGQSFGSTLGDSVSTPGTDQDVCLVEENGNFILVPASDPRCPSTRKRDVTSSTTLILRVETRYTVNYRRVSEKIHNGQLTNSRENACGPRTKLTITIGLQTSTIFMSHDKDFLSEGVMSGFGTFSVPAVAGLIFSPKIAVKPTHCKHSRLLVWDSELTTSLLPTGGPLEVQEDELNPGRFRFGNVDFKK